MSVLERVREFGTLRAMGTSKGQVGTLVVLESLWLGLISGLAGAAFGPGLALLINHLKLRMPPPPGASEPLDLILKVEPSDLLAVVAFMVVLLGLASLFPALRVVRLRIAQALAYD
jgi:putative ABC transport system permease protein